MTAELSFNDEIGNLMYAAHGNPIKTCLQCGTCSGSCPAVEFMDHSPREIIGMIRAGLKEDVLDSNTYWTCASCYYCTVRCPAEIDIAEMMYALKRYSMWKGQHKEGLVGPVFSETFVKMIINSGRSWEPILGLAYLPMFSPKDIVLEGLMATGLILSGKLPLLPKSVKRLKNLQQVVRRIIPIGEP